ncbi:hypothetical protein, partial [Enterobacter intestinihominis]
GVEWGAGYYFYNTHHLPLWVYIFFLSFFLKVTIFFLFWGWVVFPTFWVGFFPEGRAGRGSRGKPLCSTQRGYGD